jgi:threonine dehydrogenase-like Zn-dependent dehydrogenase
MPREIVTKDGSSFWFRGYELPPLGPKDVRVKVEFASPKHGTELHLITGSVFDRKRWDPELRMFLPLPVDQQRAVPAERAVGNIVVGTVTAVGSDVSRFSVGDRVFAYAPVREEHQAPEWLWYSAAGLSDVDAVCTDPAHVAFVAVRDGNVRIGDTVAVFGLGAIGLLAVQIAKAGGARMVFAVDPVSARRAYAEAHGACLALDPSSCDAALEIKLATGKSGVDVAIETSGNARALNEAIRCVRQCGTVVHVPWGPKNAADLHLDEEFHLNRITMVGSQAVWNNPDRSHPLWNEERARQTVADLFRDGVITGEGIVTPILPFEDAPSALPELFSNPEKAIKVGVRLS